MPHTAVQQPSGVEAPLHACATRAKQSRILTPPLVQTPLTGTQRPRSRAAAQAIMAEGTSSSGSLVLEKELTCSVRWPGLVLPPWAGDLR